MSTMTDLKDKLKNEQLEGLTCFISRLTLIFVSRMTLGFVRCFVHCLRHLFGNVTTFFSVSTATSSCKNRLDFFQFHDFFLKVLTEENGRRFHIAEKQSSCLMRIFLEIYLVLKYVT